jgi:phage/plasmid-like protein (TIGR03299 family)
MPANVDSMMYYGEVPWHGIGTQLDHPATSQEAIQAAGLDWEVRCGNITVAADDEIKKPVEIPDHFCTVRMDKKVPLGIVGRLYTPIQNKEAFSFFDAVVGEKKAIYQVAGALGVGETVWILAKLPEDIRIIGTDDIINKYLLLTNKHDGTMSLRMFFTPIRVVCQNTLSAALSARKAGEGVTLRHFPDIHKKADQAAKTLGIAMDYYRELSEAFNELARFEVQGDTWLDDYLEAVMPAAQNREPSTRLLNIRAGMKEKFESPSNSLPGIKNTAWAAYNAVTEYVDHTRKVPKTDSDKTRRLANIWLGSGAQIKEKALYVALDKSGVSKRPKVVSPLV